MRLITNSSPSLLMAVTTPNAASKIRSTLNDAENALPGKLLGGDTGTPPSGYTSNRNFAVSAGMSASAKSAGDT